MSPSSHRPLGMVFFIWILGEIACITQAPPWVAVWREIVVATRSGLPGWRVFFAWGLGSRWLEDAPESRQRFADGCGAAVLQVLLQSRGPTVPQTLLWNLTRLPSGGTTLDRMAEIASRFGVECRVHRLPCLPVASATRRGASMSAQPVVLHLKRAHFVVLLSLTESNACILDPALGFILVTRESLRRQVSGLALSCRRRTAAAPCAEMPNRWQSQGGQIP